MPTPGVTLAASLSLNATVVGSHALTPGAAGVAISKSLEMSPGSASLDQADVMFADQRNLAASGSETLDLTGTLLNPLGATVTEAEVVAIYLEALTGGIVVGAAAANGFFGPLNAAGTLTLNAGEFVLLSSRAGYPVVAATGDLLKIAAAGAAAATYKVVIVGRSVAQ